MKSKIAMGLVAACSLMSNLSCSPEATKSYAEPFFIPTEVTQNLNTQAFNPQVDILFVVDNSSSMGEFQQNLSLNISQFTTTFLKQSLLDYNIAVVTTDMDAGVNNCCGIFVGRQVKVVNKKTALGDYILQKNILVGTSGSYQEQSFAPVLTALSPGLLNYENKDFLRKDAALVVIFITDAQDQSPKGVTPKYLYDFLLSLKGGKKEMVMAFGILPNDTDCSGEEGTSTAIETFLGMVSNAGANKMSLCAPDFGQQLTQFGTNIISAIAQEVKLQQLPAEGTIKVTYGAMILPKEADTGWAYNKSRNVIVFGPHVDWASQPVGSQLNISYEPAL